MIKKSALLLSLLTLGACNEQTLNIQVQKSFQVYKSPTDQQMLQIPTGDYAMKVETGPSSSTITLAPAMGSAITFKSKTLKSLGNIAQNTEDANVLIPSSQLEQTFGVQFQAKKTLVSTSEAQERTESCLSHYETVYRRYCYEGRTVCDDRGRCRHSPGYCESRPERVAVYGRRNIRGRILSYLTNNQLKILQRDGIVAVTHLLQNASSRFEVLSAGRCR